ncbi:MAG: ABC transporter permease [Thermoplasmata archaeon]|jgi:ABC-type dipeptide/oligopeptide/nickel transport system permease component
MGRSLRDLAVFIAIRFAELIPVVIGAILITFIFIHIGVSDPCTRWIPRAKPDALAACRNYFGLNQPIDVQFYKYLVQLVGGNWGVDPNGTGPVLPAIAQALPETVELVLASLFLMIVFGITLGVVAAHYAGRWPDHLVRIFYLSGWAAPTYLAAIVLAIAVGPFLGLPTSGDFTTNPPPFPQPTHMSVLDALLAGNLPYTLDAITHLILPATALAFLNLGIITRMTRASMLEVLPLEYVKSAKMKGLSQEVVLFKHALRNSLITTTTVLGFTASGLLSGTVVVEEIFSWPGIGQYAYNAIINYNFAGTIGVVIVFSISVVVANLIADILYGIIDPRVDWR